MDKDIKVAVIIRCHVASQKLLRLTETLSQSSSYDLYVSANETHGQVKVGDYATVPYTLADLRALGFSAPDDLFIINCSDLLFEYYRRKLPYYDFYLLIEHDVGFADDSSAFLDELIGKLRSKEFANLDLGGTWISPREPGWSHYDNAAKVFDKVYAVFFPLVIMSRRAISHLFDLRLKLEGPDKATKDRVYCECFVGSALVCEPTLRVVDLLEMFPGCYTRSSFYWGLPMFQEARPGFEAPVRLLHPIYDGAAGLEAHYWYALHSGTLPQYQAALRASVLPLSDAMTKPLADRAKGAMPVWPAILGRGSLGSGHTPRSDLPVVVLGTRASCSLVGGDEPTPLGPPSSERSNHIFADLRARFGTDIIFVADMDERAPADTSDERESGNGLRVLLCAPSSSVPAQIEAGLLAVGRGPACVLCAKGLIDLDPVALAAFHKDQDKLATVVVAQPPSLPLALAGQIAASLDQLPLFGELWVRVGAMVLSPGAGAYLKRASSADELLALLGGDGQLAVYRHTGFWQEVGTAVDRTIFDVLTSEVSTVDDVVHS